MKVAIIGAVMGVIAIAIVAGALLMNRSTTQTPAPQNSVMLDEVNEETAPNSLRDLMSLSANQVCTSSDETGNEGTVYVGGGKMRGDFVSTTDDQSLGTHMVTDSSNVYMWFDGQNEGFKMSLAEIEKFTDFGEDLPAQAGGQKSVDLDQEVNLDCNSWSVDNSKFNLPSIEFKDFSSLIAPSGDTKVQCDTCNSLPSEAQAQCRQALGC